MAYGNPGNPGPSENFEDAGEMESHAQNGEKTDEMGTTTLVPKSICPGMEFKPGEEMVLRVKRVMDDQYLMEYAPGEKGEGEMEGEHQEEGSHSGDSEMSSMMY